MVYFQWLFPPSDDLIYVFASGRVMYYGFFCGGVGCCNITSERSEYVLYPYPRDSPGVALLTIPWSRQMVNLEYVMYINYSTSGFCLHQNVHLIFSF